ncbi:Uncharacterized protein OS=Singulisphaera acidiphila (strain ATCC BAA-1392 / DSM 18658 / VKM B-2454 / MOB10) GN=Sinac_1679 PE=4 SV=1 [Gemmataceae bacterium]|nr:Uncharacterized protein OS=Singulisphaera acidiphila (strain ATCC BAA-1392 / DSM 18658 / VKM B-2454 / MOB10) GN=Sinac_1679 PE=4 SV=1 [Gemmataceae bacterium]VTT97136.1 Uncharacterized protein OS=Singulisphaera acidiphila (strain ATCC BAA-1392 / DSM 18658 / VKM B-2454 / MOB10) GN=Sinac_1679 PE=4 SV=1 [Gemmataceae bacterium]
MTEAEWLACKDARDLVTSGACPASPRKLRLLAVACCRCSRRLLQNPEYRRALDLAEQYADGLVGQEALIEAHRKANGLACRLYPEAEAEREIRRAAEATAIANVVNPGDDPASDAIWQLSRACQRGIDARMVALAHDILGNPFRRVERNAPWVAEVRAMIGDAVYRCQDAFNPAWLSSDVLALAQGIYDERAFDRMPVLADALQDAGCENVGVLNHCRDASATHVRGCWVVDLALDKG